MKPQRHQLVRRQVGEDPVELSRGLRSVEQEPLQPREAMAHLLRIRHGRVQPA